MTVEIEPFIRSNAFGITAAKAIDAVRRRLRVQFRKTEIRILLQITFVVVSFSLSVRVLATQITSPSDSHTEHDDGNRTDATVSANLIGSLDLVSEQGQVAGWAANSFDFGQTITVHFYIDGEATTGGSFIGDTQANQPRRDLRAIGVEGNHGYAFSIPEIYRDGAMHRVYVYVINPIDPNGNHPLPGAGRSQLLQVPCTSTACPQIPISSNDGSIVVSAVGVAQTVYSYATDRCDSLDIPDLPARAFRDAKGNVNLISTHYVDYRNKGRNLDSVKHDCNVILESGNKTEFNAYQYHEWLAATYTLDGKRVYGLVHNEWYAYLVDNRCSGSPLDGWVNAITQVISTNGGAKYKHPKRYLARIPPVPWQTGNPSFVCNSGGINAYGAFEPSNILYKDGYYYTMFHSEKDPTGITSAGACIMRTTDVSNADSWTVWTGTNWEPSLSTPGCAILDSDNIQKMHESVTYNSYLGMYLLVGFWLSPSRVSYSTSQDLIHWTPSVGILLSNDPAYGVPLPQGRLTNPSLLDPTDTSRNFENTGQMPYLYFTIWHNGLDRDLVRQKIVFTKLTSVDNQAPTVPTGLTASAISSSQVSLAWTTSTDNIKVAGYAIYRNGSQIGTTSSSTFDDRGVSANTTYTYTVAAYDPAGNTSVESTPASVTTPRSSEVHELTR
jgi:hypothetical protein